MSSKRIDLPNISKSTFTPIGFDFKRKQLTHFHDVNSLQGCLLLTQRAVKYLIGLHIGLIIPMYTYTNMNSH